MAGAVKLPAAGAPPTVEGEEGPAQAEPLLGDTSTSKDTGASDGVFYFLDGRIISPARADERAKADGRVFESGCCWPAVDNPLRACCIHGICNKQLDTVILLIISFNSIYMLFEPTILEPGSTQELRAMVVEWSCMSFFTVELLMRIVAQGLVGRPTSFVKDPWNLLDFAVVAPFWVKVAFPDAPAMGAMRLLRAFRPLRAIKQAPALRRTVVAFLNSIPALSTIAGLTASFILVFGVFGVELFAGAFRDRCDAVSDGLQTVNVDAEVTYCSLDSPPSAPRGCGANAVCRHFNTNPVATATFGGFDSFSDAFIVLLQAMTFNEWQTPLYAVLNARPEGAWYTILYFNVCAAIGGFFVFNLFVAVIFDEVIRSTEALRTIEHKEAAARARREESARQQWSKAGSLTGLVSRAGAPASAPAAGASAAAPETAPAPATAPAFAPAAAQQASPPPSPPSAPTPAPASTPKDSRKRKSKMTVLNDCCGFEGWLKPIGYTTTLVVTTNVVIMCAPYRGMNDVYATKLELIADACTAYFCCEALLKICLYGGGNPCTGWMQYWSLRDDCIWNRLDFTILAIDLVSSALEILLAQFMDGEVNTTVLRALRVFRALRILRAFKLGRVWGSLNKALNTFYKGIVPVASLAVLVLLFTIIFAILGKEIYGGTGLAEVSRWNYDKPLPALLTAMTIFTGEWAAALYETIAADVVPKQITVLFIVLALLIGHFVVINLFVAELVNAFVAEERAQKDKATKLAGAPSNEERSQLIQKDQNQKDNPSELSEVSPSSPIRRACRGLLVSDTWKSVVVIVILISCACIVLDNPRLDPLSALAHQLKWADYAITVFFGFEALLKMFVGGIFCGRSAYFTSGWNWLDCIILVSSIVAVLPIHMHVANDMRLLRILRPLRLIDRVPGVKVIFKFFAHSLVDLLNVMGVVLFFQLIFAVIGMQLFMHVDFEHPALSFRSFGSSMLFLFVMATGDAWDDAMWTAMDAPANAGEAPVRNDDSPAALYFLAWVYVGHFVMMNFFVATVVISFMRIKEEQELIDALVEGSAIMTREQKQWQIAVVAASRQKATKPAESPEAPEGILREFVYGVVISDGFNALMSLVVLFNVIVMAFNHYGIEENVALYELYTTLMKSCVHLYYAEAALKVYGLGVGYFSDGWNKFDFALVLTAVLEESSIAVILHDILPIPPTVLRVLRIARLLRAVRLLRGFKGLRNIAMTLILAFPQFLNVGFFLALVIFIYSILGVQLFAFVGAGEALHDQRNFHNVLSASEVLYECVTGDGWSLLMLDALDSGECDPQKVPTDCGRAVALPYFVSYQVVAMLVLANLIVAVILQNFSECGDNNPMLASNKDIDLFDDGWSKVDKEANGYIDSEDFATFLVNLDRPLRPLGVPYGDTPKHRDLSRNIVKSLVERGDLPKFYGQSGSYLNYNHVLRTLIDNSYKSYSRTFPEEPIAAPPIVESTPIAGLRGWGLLRSLGIVGVLRAQYASTGTLSPSMLARAKLGKGTQAQQIRSLTDLLRLTSDETEALEKDSKRYLEKISDLESLLTAEQRTVVVQRVTERREKEQARFKTTTAASATAMALANKDLLAKGQKAISVSRPPREQFDPFVGLGAPARPTFERSAIETEEEMRQRLLREANMLQKANFGDRSGQRREKGSKYRDLTYHEQKFEERARKEQENPMKAPPLGTSAAKRGTNGASPAPSARGAQMSARSAAGTSPTPRAAAGGAARAKLPSPAPLPPPQRRPSSGGKAGGHVVLEEKGQQRAATRC